MMMRPFALALVLVAAGCSPIADRCGANTLVVSVTLDSASAAADSFAVAVSIDGAASTQATVAHSAGATHGNLVVTFPHGYPRGHTIGVEVDALVAGAVVGHGSASQPLAGSCEVTPLSISAAAGDLGVDDMTAGDDLTPPADLTPPPADLTCIPSGAETGSSCFDGVDNDCDGHIDCDDPDCTMAQCVPAPSTGFVVGITIASGFCPAMFASQEIINSGLTAASPACSTNMCSCTGQMGCMGSFTSYSQSQGCSGEGETVSANAGCSNWNVNQTTTALEANGVAPGSGMCLTSGTSAKSAVSWTTSDIFCKATSMGGGCPAGNVCVPKLAVATCELADGNPACDSGYTASGGPWFNAFSDGRTCSCGCGAASGGSCSNTYNVYSSNDCTGSPVFTLNAGSQNCSVSGTNFHSTKIASTVPTCGAPSGNVGGTGLVGTGPKKLCCRP